MGTFQDANGQGIFTVPGDLDAYMASRGHILLEVNLVAYASSSNAQPGDVMTVDADYGRLNVMRVKV